jgi:pimeloyl-ACP methyl ester carboxylesterase
VPFRSRVLRDNPLGDPVVRQEVVYTPPSGETRGKPLLVYLAGFLGAGWNTFVTGQPFGESLVQRVDRLMRHRECPEAVLLAPDCLTTLGGSQYVNSPATGRYEDHVMDELLPWARAKYGTGPVALFGQSSGGFGALHLALQRPGALEAVGSSAGDMSFEYCYLPEFPRAIRHLRSAGGVDRFLRGLLATPPTSLSPSMGFAAALDVVAMSSCYSPVEEEPGAFELPFDPGSGAIRPEVWERWMTFDPCRRLRVEKDVQAFRRLRLLLLNASGQDEWGLDVAAFRFAEEAKRRGLSAEYREYPGGHFDKGPRLEDLVRRLAQTLAGEEGRPSRSRRTRPRAGESS